MSIFFKASFFLLFNILIWNFFIPPAISEEKFSANATYTVCFTPGEDCTNKIVNVLNNAKKSIFVQAYSFTSRPIGKALIDANKRGIKVNVILDKSQVSHRKYSAATFFA